MNRRWGRIFWPPGNCSGADLKEEEGWMVVVGELELELEGLLRLEERSLMGVDMVMEFGGFWAVCFLFW